MTDRIHSCRQSPNGRHRFTVSPLMCDYCSRTTTYLTDMGWNAPAVDPDWVDQEADVNDAPDRANGRPECSGPNSPLHHWCCERPEGHRGPHMAWDVWPTKLYDGGVWD